MTSGFSRESALPVARSRRLCRSSCHVSASGDSATCLPTPGLAFTGQSREGSVARPLAGPDRPLRGSRIDKVALVEVLRASADVLESPVDGPVLACPVLRRVGSTARPQSNRSRSILARRVYEASFPRNPVIRRRGMTRRVIRSSDSATSPQFSHSRRRRIAKVSVSTVVRVSETWHVANRQHGHTRPRLGGRFLLLVRLGLPGSGSLPRLALSSLRSAAISGSSVGTGKCPSRAGAFAPSPAFAC